jgi:hypothetical protein
LEFKELTMPNRPLYQPLFYEKGMMGYAVIGGCDENRWYGDLRKVSIFFEDISRVESFSGVIEIHGINPSPEEKKLWTGHCAIVRWGKGNRWGYSQDFLFIDVSSSEIAKRIFGPIEE